MWIFCVKKFPSPYLLVNFPISMHCPWKTELTRYSYSIVSHLSGHGAASVASVLGNSLGHIVAFLLDAGKRDAEGGLESVSHVQVRSIDQLAELPAGNVVTLREMR